MKVMVYEGNLAASIPDGHFYHELMRSLPKRRFLPAKKLWVFPPWLSVMKYVKHNFPALNWDPAAEARFFEECSADDYRAKVASGEVEFDTSSIDGPFKLPPYDHQLKALAMGRDQEVFAYLMDQGTGKTKVILDDAAYNFREGRINALLVASPNSVKTNWVDTASNDDEVEKHIAPDIPFIKAAYFSVPNRDQKDDWEYFWKHLKDLDILMILSINVETLWRPKAREVLDTFLRKRKVMFIIDESTRIGERASRRTKPALDMRERAELRRIASGTPVIKSPLKAYTQFGFLDPNILGSATFTEFQARYAVMSKMKDIQKEIAVKFVNMDELSNKIAGCSFRVTKEQCLDLPPKVYQKRLVEMTALQAKWYEKMRDDALVWLNKEHKVEAPTVLSEMVRLQQITAGYLPVLDPITREQTGIAKIGNGPPPKIQEAIDIIEETEGKVIVWCKFKFEIEEMRDACKAANINHVTFYGETTEEARALARQQFQNDPSLRVFIGQVRTGGIGITLHAASTVVYLSNTFSTEDRVQSEDRAHRIGQTKSVNYYDLIVPKTIDVRIMQVLRDNRRISDAIMRDGYRSWI